MNKAPKDFFYNNSDESKKSFSKQTLKAHTYQFPINESEEFYDPFSDISLFLANKIKNQILSTKKKNWNNSIQKTLVKEILPEFIHKFPKYNLRISALQKTFDKVQYYIKMLNQKRGQLTDSGKINLHKIIRENLTGINSENFLQHPFNLSHSLAVKISECIATIDNTRPNIVELTKLIWSAQKNLILKKDLKSKCPFESFNSQDKLIARLQIESIAENPNMGQKELRECIKKKLVYLQQIKRMRCKKTLNTLFWSILADKTSENSTYKQSLSQEMQENITAFIKTIVLNQNLSHKKHLAQSAKRLEFLLNLSKITSKENARKELIRCISYIQKLNYKKVQLSSRVMNEEVFNLLFQEISLYPQGTNSEKIVDGLLENFDSIKLFSSIPSEVICELPILFFKVVNQELSPLKGISKMMQEVIFNEICYQKLEKNKLLNQDAIDKSIEYIQSQEIQINGILKRIYPWSLQNDMIFQYLHFDAEDILFKTVKNHFNENLLMTSCSLKSNLNEICDNFLKDHPTLKSFKKPLLRQILIFYKATYYNRFEHQTPYQLFLQYHFMLSLGKDQGEFQEVQINTLFEKSEKLTPLMPFSRVQIRHLIDDVKKQLKFA